MSSAQASPGVNSKSNKKNSVFIISIVQLIVSCIRRQALKKCFVRARKASTTYLGEELDVIADSDEVHLPVKSEDVHPTSRAAGVKDDRVPATLPGPRILRRLSQHVDDGSGGLATKHVLGKGRAAAGELQENKHGGNADGTSSRHWS
jgi:hypothetical protein